MFKSGRSEPGKLTIGKAISKRKHILQKMTKNINEIHQLSALKNGTKKQIEVNKKAIKQLEQANIDLATQHITLTKQIQDVNDNYMCEYQVGSVKFHECISSLLLLRSQANPKNRCVEPRKTKGVLNLALQTFEPVTIPTGYDSCVDVERRAKKHTELKAALDQINHHLSVHNDVELSFGDGKQKTK